MALSLAVAAVAAPAIASVSNLDAALEEYVTVTESVSQETEPEALALEAILNEITNPVSEIVIAQAPKEERWVGVGFSEVEQKVERPMIIEATSQVLTLRMRRNRTMRRLKQIKY